MLWRKELKFYLLLLRVTGILPVTFCYFRHKLIMTQSDCILVLVLTLVVLFVMEGSLIFTVLLAFKGVFNIYGDLGTGNALLLFQIIATSLLQLAFSTWFFVHKRKHICLLNAILKHAFKPAFPDMKMEDLQMSGIKRSVLLHMGLYIAFIINLVATVFWFPMSRFVRLCLLITLSVRVFFSCFALSYYLCMVIILRYLRSVSNKRMERIASRAETPNDTTMCNFKRALKAHTELQGICSIYINSIWGVPLLIEACYILCTAPAFLFLLFMLFQWFESRWLLILRFAGASLMWVLPPIVIFIQVVINNSKYMEANKTAKIISRIPRSGTAMDKMIEKFLLKNIHQRPVLTAYGFFSLDKSTLFKLFTAISTYMVILVQFKEMETETKHQHNRIN